MGAEGAKAISETLKINSTLTSLNLIGDDKIEKRKEIEKRKKKKMMMNNEQHRI